MVNGTKRGPKQLGEIILDTANVNGISTEFLEKSIQRLINILAAFRTGFRPVVALRVYSEREEPLAVPL